jgi:AcrR family transcriptional regulator
LQDEVAITAPRPRQLPPDRPGPAGGKRDRNRRRRLGEIGRAGLELMLEHGLERVTIDEICTRAGIAKGSFYRYFADKEALVGALLEPLTEQSRVALVACERALHAARTSAELMTAYQTLAFALAPVFLEEQGAVRLYLQESRGPAVGARAPVRALSDAFRQHAVAITAAAHSHDLLRKLPPAVTALAVVGAVERLAFDFLSGEIEEDPVTVAQALVTMILQGVGVDPT